MNLVAKMVRGRYWAVGADSLHIADVLLVKMVRG